MINSFLIMGLRKRTGVLRNPGRLGAVVAILFLYVGVAPYVFATVARINFENGNYTQATWQYRHALTISPFDYPEWLYHLGQAAHKNGDLDLAISAYSRLLKVAPTWRDAHLELGRVLFVQGGKQNLIDSISYETSELQLYPDNIRAYYVRGLINGWLQRWEEAEQDFLAFTNVKPDSPWGWNDLAWIYFSQSKWQQAEQAARKSIELDDNFMWGYNGLGLTLLNQQRYSEAKDALVKALALAESSNEETYLEAYPGNSMSFAPYARDTFSAGIAFNLGLTYAKMNEEDNALHAFQTALSYSGDPTIEEKSGITKSVIEEEIAKLSNE